MAKMKKEHNKVRRVGTDPVAHYNSTRKEFRSKLDKGAGWGALAGAGVGAGLGAIPWKNALRGASAAGGRAAIGGTLGLIGGAGIGESIARIRHGKKYQAARESVKNYLKKNDKVAVVRPGHGIVATYTPKRPKGYKRYE